MDIKLPQLRARRRRRRWAVRAVSPPGSRELLYQLQPFTVQYGSAGT